MFFSYLDFIATVLRAAVEAGDLRVIDTQFCAFMLDESDHRKSSAPDVRPDNNPIEEDAEAVLELFLRGCWHEVLPISLRALIRAARDRTPGPRPAARLRLRAPTIIPNA